jgi:hypothetical protein
MGVVTDYFSAPSDETAAAFIDHGPAHGGLTGDDEIGAAFRAAQQAGDHAAAIAAFRPRVQAAADGTLVLRAKNVLPVVELATLESLLTGVSYDEVTAGPRAGAVVADADGGEILVMTVTDELQKSLASSDSGRLAEVAIPWSETDELFGAGNPAALTKFLTALAELARAAIARGERLYCWSCV